MPLQLHNTLTRRKEPFVPRDQGRVGIYLLKGEKMARSVGNVVSPRELLRRHRGVVLRYALLGAHCRSRLEFSEEVLADAAASYDRLATFATNAARALTSPLGAGPSAGNADPGGARTRFQAALDDDLNAADAIRDRLADAGIRVEDRPGGPRWHLIP